MNPAAGRLALEAQPPVRGPGFPPRAPLPPVQGLVRPVHSPRFLPLDRARRVPTLVPPACGAGFPPPDPAHVTHGPEFLPPGLAWRVHHPAWSRTVRINYVITAYTSRQGLDFFRQSGQANAYFPADGKRSGDDAGEGVH